MRERIITRTLKRKQFVGLQDLYKVREKLKLSFVPQKIISREKEQQAIQKIVAQFMDSETCYGSGLCCYFSFFLFLHYYKLLVPLYIF